VSARGAATPEWSPATEAAPAASLGRTAAGWCVTTGVLVLAAGAPITQWMAGRLGHSPALGRPVYDGWYWPWKWIEWRLAGWPGAAPLYDTLDNGLLAAACLAPALAGWALNQNRTKPKKHDGVHGTARLATRDELVKAGLLPTKGRPGRGLYLAMHRERNGSFTYLRHEGPEHVACTGPLRCGKTLGPVIMNCLSGEDESLIAYDAKGTIYRDSAGWRKSHGNRVLRWDMAAERDTVRWNPLREVRLRTIQEYADVANIIESVADPKGEGLDGGKDHFPPVAAEFLTGLTLFVLYERRACRREWACPADVLRALADPDREPKDLYEAMARNTFGPGGARHEEIAAAGAAQMKRPDKERGSVHSTAGRMLRLFRDPIIARNTAVSDFRIADLMDGANPVSLYVIPREEHRLRLRPLTRLFAAMAMDRLCSADIAGGPGSAHKRRLRWLYDEFAAEGPQEKFVDALSRCPEFGIRVMIFTQDYQQIVGAYGREETVTGMCSIKVGYTPNGTQTAEWMAGWGGRATVHTEDVSESGSSNDGKRGFNRAFHTVSRDLLTADEVTRVPRAEKDQDGRITAPGKVLVKVAGCQLAVETQALAIFDPEFEARRKIPAPPTDTLLGATP
jgi:type IV secretion system protein VirD4